MRHEPSFLKDILSACRKIETIVATTDEGSFLKDEVLPAAVLHHLTVIGDVPFVCRLERSPSGSTLATNYCRAAQDGQVQISRLNLHFATTRGD